MAFLDENVLWHLFWVIPLFFTLFAAACKRRKRLLEKYPGKDAFPKENILLSRKARSWRIFFLFLTVLFLFIAAARPFWGNRLMPYSGEGRDLLFVFDVSKSMYAQDVRPNRLEHAKYLVRELVRRNPGDRFGLIAFAGTAFLECPMTMDKTSFLQNLNELSPSSIPVGGTNIEEALKKALKAFKGAESTNRAIILITDGDELTGESSKALDEAVKLKIPLFIAGIGDPSEPAIIQIPDGKGSVVTLRDDKGNAVNSRLNEKALALLASKTGGIYVRSSTSIPGIDQLEARIRSLNKDLRESGKQTKPIERPLYPLTAALICLLLSFLIVEAPRKKKAILMVLFFAISFFCMNTALYAQQQDQILQPAPRGKQLPQNVLQTGDAPRVLPKTAGQAKNSGIKDPNDPFILYNAACNAHFEQKNIPEAKELYLQALSKAGDHALIRDNASLNLGTIEHASMREAVRKAKNTLQQQNLQKALEEVKQAVAKTEAIQELYKYGLLGATAEKAAVNQQILLHEKREAEKLQKAIEELIKKQQQAQKDTQKALQNQQKQQNNKDQKQNQQKQQNNKDQKQDQQKQQNNKDQKQDQQKENIRKQTSRAQQSAEEMKKQAKDLQQQKMKEQAQKAAEELKKASDAQKKDDGKKALEHLKKAAEALGKPENQKQDQQKQQENKDQQGNKDNKDNKKDPSRPEDQKQNQQKQQNKPNQQQQQNRKEEPLQYDKKQAESLLDLMVKDEKNLKEELKARMLKNQGLRKVEKDW